ncbi:MAG: phospholipase D family protein [Candidatus Sericytochromatia bacterium]|uniref:Phospholipase D family protein n=1 Tax=Candidatus Tanganyikabacteria bacterium TaxID=2961651 RepID=A0A937X4J6_9BACT|nr:phospholipase D family protein [Candidatus Tanganyikabacteria bacterium]
MLVSTQHALDEIGSDVLRPFKEVYVFDDSSATFEIAGPGDSTTNQGQVGDTDAVLRPDEARGLHAKLFVTDEGWDASVWTGSANATASAFERNVEFLVELTGKKSKVGIDALIAPATDGRVTFRNLLERYSIERQASVPDAASAAIEDRLEALRRFLAGKANLGLEVRSAEAGFDVVLQGDPVPAELLAGIRAVGWLATFDQASAKPLDALVAGKEVAFRVASVVSISAFLAIELAAGSGDAAQFCRFALKLPLIGAPGDRIPAILRHLLGDREHFLRYLLFLLARDANEKGTDAGSARRLADLLAELPPVDAGNGNRGPSLPLVEELLRALSRAPERLDAVHDLLREVTASADGASLLPAGFREVWEPIWAARESVR